MRAGPGRVAALIRGRIYTGFMPAKRVEALVTLGDRVLYAGDYARAARLARELRACGLPIDELELGDAVAVPGFVDAHIHMGSLGMALEGLDLRGVSSIEELKRAVAEAARAAKGWIFGRGWDQERLGRWPTRWDLDEAAPGRPVVLVRVCGHAAVLSTEAMRRLGLLGARGLPGLQVREDGEPTGVVFEDLVRRALEEVRRSVDARALLLRASQLLASRGITMVGDMDVDGLWLAGLLAASKELSVRVRAYLSLDAFEQLARLGLRAGVGDGMVRIVGVKLFADGSLGARTARLSRPYSDSPSERGVLLADGRRVAEVARRARRLGYDVAVHAIGDEALDHVLRGFAEAGYAGRVEHASVVRDDQLAVISRLGVRVVVQPAFLRSDFWLRDRLGDRVGLAYRFRSLMLAAGALGFSSDAPVEQPSPLENVYLAVTREGLGGAHEALTVEEALYAHTRGAALALGEAAGGCLEPGCYADVAVLSVDPLAARPADIASAAVEATLVAGRLVHGSL